MTELERLNRGVRLRNKGISLDIEETLEGNISLQIYGPDYGLLSEMHGRVLRFNSTIGKNNNHVMLHDDDSFVNKTGMKITKGLTGIKLELVGRPESVVGSVTVSKDSDMNSKISYASAYVLTKQLQAMPVLQEVESQELKVIKAYK